MLDNQLETFICIVENGSFSKAAELLYLSPTAVMKRINSLENRLDFKLFNRTAHGIELTPSGEYFYTNCKKLVHELYEITQNAKERDTSSNTVLRIGNSLGYPALFTEVFLPQLSSLCKGIHFEFVHYPFSYDNNQKLIQEIGTVTDVVIDSYDLGHVKTITGGQVKALRLFDIEMVCYLSTQHPLASHHSIHVEDLYGETVYIPQSKNSSFLETLIEEFRQQPQIKIRTYNPFDFLTAQNILDTGNIYVSFENFPLYNPVLKRLPLHWDRHNCFGILYREDSPLQSNINLLLQSAEEVLSVSR